MLLGAILGRALVAIAQTFSTIETTAAGVSDGSKYAGAAAVGTSVFFAPVKEDNVGVLDTTTSTFSTIDTTATGVNADWKYRRVEHTRPRVAFCLFGTVARSISLTWSVIKRRAIEPLQRGGFDVDVLVFNVNVVGGTLVDGVVLNQSDVNLVQPVERLLTES